MLNFGLTELRLVRPRDGWPNPDAGPSASGADSCSSRRRSSTRSRRRSPTARGSYASTVRRRDLVMPVLTPEEMAEEITASAERSAILFGPERSGLETEEVALAKAIVTVPINPEFASLNLAQAVILLAYEWSKHSALAQPPAKELEPPAPQGELEGLIGQLDEALDRKWLFPPAVAHSSDEEHLADDLHQDRLVVARGQGDTRYCSSSCRSAASKISPLTCLLTELCRSGVNEDVVGILTL